MQHVEILSYGSEDTSCRRGYQGPRYKCRTIFQTTIVPVTIPGVQNRIPLPHRLKLVPLRPPQCNAIAPMHLILLPMRIVPQPFCNVRRRSVPPSANRKKDLSTRQWPVLLRRRPKPLPMPMLLLYLPHPETPARSSRTNDVCRRRRGPRRRPKRGPRMLNTRRRRFRMPMRLTMRSPIARSRPRGTICSSASRGASVPCNSIASRGYSLPNSSVSTEFKERRTPARGPKRLLVLRRHHPDLARTGSGSCTIYPWRRRGPRRRPKRWNQCMLRSENPQREPSLIPLLPLPRGTMSMPHRPEIRASTTKRCRKLQQVGRVGGNEFFFHKSFLFDFSVRGRRVSGTAV